MYFPLHLQTSNFCEEAINKSEKPDEKYEDGGRQKWSHNSEEEDQIREDPAMYQDKADEEEGEEPEDLTSSIERLRRFVFHSHFNRVVLKCLMDTAINQIGKSKNLWVSYGRKSWFEYLLHAKDLTFCNSSLIT